METARRPRRRPPKGWTEAFATGCEKEAEGRWTCSTKLLSTAAGFEGSIDALLTYAGEPEAKLHERRLARIKIEWSAQAQNSSAWPAFLSKRGTPDAAGPILAAKAKPLFSAAGSQGAQFKSAIWIFKSPSAQRFETSAIGAFDAKGHLIGLLAESSLFAEPPAPPQKTDSP